MNGFAYAEIQLKTIFTVSIERRNNMMYITAWEYFFKIDMKKM